MTSISRQHDARDTETGTGTEPPPGRQTYLDRPPDELASRIAETGLRNALRLNAEFSLVTGLVATIAAGWTADLLGVEQTWLVRLLGVGLLVFAVDLFAIAGMRTDLLRRLALVISLADFGWVVATIGVIAAGWLSTTGAVVMAIIAAIVAEFGIIQLRRRTRIRHLDNADGETPPVEIVSWRRSMPITAERLWPIMTDHELYAKLALNLSGAAAMTPNGPGMTRTCTDTSGRSWSETCTLWRDGRRFDIAVDTSDYPYPLQVMEGSWAVEPDGDGGSDVSMTFAFQPTSGLRGRLSVPVMHLLFPPILARIGRGWRRAATGR